jgi:hypothetical protein
MNTQRVIGGLLLLAAAYLYMGQQPLAPPAPQPSPVNPCPGPGPCPVPPAPPAPKPPDRPRRPWGPSWGASVGGPSLNGVEIQCDLPGPLHRANTASKGLGNCVFTSIHHAALWQNVPALEEFPKWLIQKGIPGGGYPSKVAKLIPQICKDRSLPVPDYLQVEGGDLTLLQAALKSGRMASVTYSFSPTGRYGGRRISHMVNLVHLDDQYAVILDNNYPGASKYEWLSVAEFKKTYAPGWAVILLSPPPPPAPRQRS